MTGFMFSCPGLLLQTKAFEEEGLFWLDCYCECKRGMQLIIMDNTLGRRLAEAYPNNKMIIAAIALRTCVVLFFDSAVLGYIKASIGFEAFFDTQAIIRICLLDVVMLGFCLFPLTHLKDYIYFYERAICYKGKIYLLDSLLPISWSYSALPIPVLWHQNQMVTKRRVFRLAYMEDVQKQFNKAYMNVI